ncbi:MAG: response regulator transcription factor [Campylobacterota bacterium]|nr:response regulator transcription factor [Campylobacterota bacterium]
MINSEVKKILKALTLLYIEDEKSIRDSLCSTLKLIFKEVIDTPTAEEALIIFDEKTPDIVLSDINLPSMSGIELTQKIRKKNVEIPIILLTAYTDTSILLDATKLKLISYLTKPVIFDELYQSFIDAIKDIKRFSNQNINISNTIVYDIQNSILYENKLEKDLTLSERKLLDFFIKYKDRTLSVQEIKNYIWEDSDKASDSAFKSLLNKLRQKIGQNSIKNISGVGYRLVTI